MLDEDNTTRVAAYDLPSNGYREYSPLGSSSDNDDEGDSTFPAVFKNESLLQRQARVSAYSASVRAFRRTSERVVDTVNQKFFRQVEEAIFDHHHQSSKSKSSVETQRMIKTIVIDAGTVLPSEQSWLQPLEKQLRRSLAFVPTIRLTQVGWAHDDWLFILFT